MEASAKRADVEVRMKYKTNRRVYLGALLLMGVSCFVFRVPLFSWHGMKSFPIYLFLAGATVIILSGLLNCYIHIPVFTCVGYVTGFFCGCMFREVSFDPGGGSLDNMWLIWMQSYGTSVLAGMLTEVFGRKKKRGCHE